jgi:two-component system, LytTR family, sensor kinase
MGRMLYIYSSLFIALVLNLPRLFALREDSALSHFWHLNGAEVAFHTLMNFIYCLLVFYFSRQCFRGPVKNWHFRQEGVAVMVNFTVLIGFITMVIVLQRHFFERGLLPGKGMGAKLFLSLLLIWIELRIVDLVQHARSKDIENEQLRNAHLKAELALLKGQLQPHFFFNALSSLSGVVRENPTKAQYYISQLSKVFRYSLQKGDDNLVTLREELNAIHSYAALLEMRYENGFKLDIQIPESAMTAKLPHMSLQPLLENALKHNRVMVSMPLYVSITIEDNEVVVTNNRQPVSFGGVSTGIGLSNLHERFRILMHREITILQTEEAFVVKLPLK